MTLLHDIGTLERHRLFDSHDVDETQAQVSRYLCPHRFDVLGRSGLHTRLNGVFFGGAALLDLQYHAPVRVAVRDVADHYLVRLTLAGRCEVTHGTRRAQLQPGSLSVSSPFASSSITTDGECRNVILRVPRTALATQLQLLAGRSLNQPLLFDVGVDPGHPGVASVVHTLGYLCRLQSPGLQGQALDQGLSDFVVQLLLTQLPHNHSAWLAHNRQAPLPRHVRRARDHIEAHLHQALPLAELCRVSGVSARTLQNGFSRFLGCSPADYVKDRRLAAVHQALQRAHDGQTVTQVLVDHGVHSFGHFTRAYQQRYGCTPSATLRQRH